MFLGNGPDDGTVNDRTGSPEIAWRTEWRVGTDMDPILLTDTSQILLPPHWMHFHLCT